MTTQTAPLTVDVPFADTSAEALRFSLDHGRITPLASRTVTIPPLTGAGDAGELSLELNVIGSSHQVVLKEHGTDAFIETFACLGEGVPPNWETTRTTSGPFSRFPEHRFTATFTDVTGSFDDAAAEALDRSSAHLTHLVVAFPGDPGALTALALTDCEAENLAWESWHCYPQHRQIVHSRSELGRRA